MNQKKYSHADLFGLGPQRIYKDQYLNEISFPLGGIGTGSIGLTGRGTLKDFEIFNRPNMGSAYQKTFAMIRMHKSGEEPICRILEGPIPRPYTPLDGGQFHANGEGYPHMDRVEFRGEYPFAWIDFHSDAMPLKVTLEAYNPFIPSDPDNSGIPIAVIKYKVENLSDTSLDVSILWSLLNIVGITPEETQKMVSNSWFHPNGRFMNNYIEETHVRGIAFSNTKWDEKHPRFGYMALMTPEKNITYSPTWKKIGWFNAHYHLWNTFKATGAIELQKSAMWESQDAGAIAIKKAIAPHKSETFTFYITWYFPNYVKYWEGNPDLEVYDKKPVWKNYYTKQFEDAIDVANKFAIKEEKLHCESMLFHDALFGTTLPPYIIDAIQANMAILKTTTCIRLEDGTFYGFEGCHCAAGCCEGSCTHVWGYQQALPFLFPSLERNMHDANYKYNFPIEDLGVLGFRIQLPLGHVAMTKPCADGQFGGIMHVYREWKLCGDNAWLKSLWPSVKRALDFAFEEWDEKKNGYLQSWQHNTYDVDFWGPNPMLTCYYLGALKAGSEMAKFLGDEASAKDYLAIHDRGRKWVDENLWNGEFYIQLHDPKIAKEYQIGPGCLVDQLVGQQLAGIAGLGNFLDHDHILTTLKSIFKYNWKPSMKYFENGARLYAVNDEAATIICTWPKGGRPEIMFPYADEVMIGFEYQFGVHCIQEGLLEEGLTVIKSIRDRFDGFGRNPWDEFECGHHYARSMASYGALIALTGFEFDKGQGFIGFSPKIQAEPFHTFWSLDSVWGTYTQTKNEVQLKVLWGVLILHKIKVQIFGGKSQIIVIFGEKTQKLIPESNGLIRLKDTIEIKADQYVKLHF